MIRRSYRFPHPWQGGRRMYDKLKTLIEHARWDAAEEEVDLLAQSHCDEELCVLQATVCEARGDREGERKAIARGLTFNWRNYELFFMLGLWYQDLNINQAYLCMRQAEWYCAYGGESPHDWCIGTKAAAETEAARREDLKDIRAIRIGMEEQPGLSVNGLSVMILSYNNKELMQECLQSVRRYHDCRRTEIVVVDNASTDGVAEWLRTQEDIRLIENGENVGFPTGCNIGVMSCNAENDLLLLNNDAVLTPNALFWMQMALYAEPAVGAVGAVSNHAAMQDVQPEADPIPVQTGLSGELEWWMAYGIQNNLPMQQPYEERCRLTGFAVLMKKEVRGKVLIDGKLLFDPLFSPAYFEDDDLGMRIAKAGYRQLLCHNALIYHRGGKGFSSHGNHVMEDSREKFLQKWHFDIWEYEAPWEEMIAAVRACVPDRNACARILQIDCGMGVTLSALRYVYPNAYFAGTEKRADIAGIGQHMAHIHIGSAETMELPYPEHSFHIIIVADALQYVKNPEIFLDKLSLILAAEGTMLLSAGDYNRKEYVDYLSGKGFRTEELSQDILAVRHIS